MCFTPLASIITALTEFTIGLYLIKKVRDKQLYALIAFIFLLGLYQLSEFLLCTSPNEFWTRLGFSVYTFMPVVLLHMFLNMSNKKMRNIYYVIPVFFTLLAFFHPQFITYSTCNLLHVSVHSLVFDESKVLMWFYLAYYIIAPGLGLYTFLSSKKTSQKMRLPLLSIPIAILLAQIYWIIAVKSNLNPDRTWMTESIFIFLIAILILNAYVLKSSTNGFKTTLIILYASSITTLLMLYALIPQFSHDYSSIFCQFALLYALASIILVDVWERDNHKL